MIERIPSYDDLQLRIERGVGASYRVLASASDGRTARGTFETPITDDELDDFVRRVGLLRRRGRSELERMEEIQSLGSKLFNSLIKDDVRAIYQAARGAAQENGRGLRITLQLSDAAELMRLPWEFLYSRPRFLAQSRFTPVVRSLDLPTRRRPLKVKLPLKILGMVSSPEGYQGLNADEERRRLESALSQLKSDGLVELEWLDGPLSPSLGADSLSRTTFTSCTTSATGLMTKPPKRASSCWRLPKGASMMCQATTSAQCFRTNKVFVWWYSTRARELAPHVSSLSLG